MRSDSILFDAKIPSDSKAELRKKIPFNGYIRKMTIVFYPGQEKALQVNPYVLTWGDLAIPLTKFTGDKSFFSGDDDQFNIGMSQRIKTDDYIVIEVENVSSSYDYDLYVMFEIEYEGGVA